MVDLCFWIFMLIMSLLVPACMLGFGHELQVDPPKEIDDGYGYRTSRSGKSQAAWDFAQVYSGRFWSRMGKPTLAVSLVWMALLFGRDVGTVGKSGIILMFLQLVPLLAVIPATERALERRSDDLGRKK